VQIQQVILPIKITSLHTHAHTCKLNAHAMYHILSTHNCKSLKQYGGKVKVSQLAFSCHTLCVSNVQLANNSSK